MIDRPIPTLFLRLAVAAVMSCAAACVSVEADTGYDERLATFPQGPLPVEKPVTLYWNDYQIPYVVAETDGDAAFALGLVHAHLRGVQTQLARRVVEGRISEMAGPVTTDIDHALRTLGLARAAPEIAAALPAETRAWLQRFADGLNYYQDRAKDKPPAFGLLGIDHEPWTVEDIIAVGRIGSVDVNWISYAVLLPLLDKENWEWIWRRALDAGSAPAVSFRREAETAALIDLFTNFGKSGSNTVVVAPKKSANGSALIANDPHLGMALPNLWLLAGVKSPSFNVVGMMIPGVPVFALGRNPHMAWGGTNLRAASSDLYDVSALPEEAFTEFETEIGRRLWFDATRTVRLSPYGPVISDMEALDTPEGRDIALKWVGHEVSDEITALLRVARARTPEEFRQAFKGFGVSAQNMMFADVNGNIGQTLAMRLPIRVPRDDLDLVLDPADPASRWQGYATALELPFSLNPPEGFLASANNKPTDYDLTISYFFSDDDRVRRLQEFVRNRGKLTIADLKELQRDVRSPDAQRLALVLAGELRAALRPAGPGQAVVEALDGWDGTYAAEMAAPVAFEALLYHLVPPLYGFSDAGEMPFLYAQWSFLTDFLARDLAALDGGERQKILRAAAAAAAEEMAEFPSWGDMHKVRVAHLLANVPVIGDRFVVDEFPASGSRETVLKRAHGLVNEEHRATYGSQSRHISDLSHPDENYFVLFGGQDGWIGSANFADQVKLWREGRYIKLPLTLSAVAAQASTVMRITPGAAKEGPAIAARP